MSNIEVVFIYAKDNKIKALNTKDAENQHELLIHNGWKHTATLDPCIFIGELFNNVPDGELRRSINSIAIV